jgi:hypothetical protein
MSFSGHSKRPYKAELRARSVTAARLVILESLADAALSGDRGAAGVLLNQMASPVPQKASQDAQVGIPGMVVTAP